MSEGDQSTSQTLKKSFDEEEKIFFDKYGDEEHQQEVINATARTMLSKGAAFTKQRMSGYMESLCHYCVQRSWLLRGMSKRAEQYLKSTEEDIAWYELKIELCKRVMEKLG